MKKLYLFVAGAVLFLAIGCFLVYQKTKAIEKHAYRIERDIYFCSLDMSKVDSAKLNSSATNRLNFEINELKKLKEYISELQGSTFFISSCLKKIEFEIELQEALYFRELGKEIYNNKAQLP